MLILCLCLTLHLTQIFAQYAPEELAERPKWEDFLKTAEITSWKEAV